MERIKQALERARAVAAAACSRAGRLNRVTLAFALVVLVSFAALSVMAWEIHVARDVSNDNRVLVKNVASAEKRIAGALADVKAEKASVAGLQKAQTQSCVNYETLRSAHNAFVGTVRKFLQTAARRNAEAARLPSTTPALKKQDRAAAKVYGALISNSRIVTASCAQKRPGS